MAWLQDYGFVFDIAICLLLVTTIGYAVVLNRKLSVLRDARGEMEKLFADFAAATGEAEGGLQALKESSSVAGETLAQKVDDACRLADEMAFLVKKGNEIADRLEVAISASRKAARAAETSSRAGPDTAPATAAAPSPTAAGAKIGAVGETAPRGFAKLAKRKLSSADSELMRALQAIR